MCVQFLLVVVRQWFIGQCYVVLRVCVVGYFYFYFFEGVRQMLLYQVKWCVNYEYWQVGIVGGVLYVEGGFCVVLGGVLGVGGIYVKVF